MQFGAKPLFENISVKFGDGNRYGLIGAEDRPKIEYLDYDWTLKVENYAAIIPQ